MQFVQWGHFEKILKMTYGLSAQENFTPHFSSVGSTWQWGSAICKNSTKIDFNEWGFQGSESEWGSKGTPVLLSFPLKLYWKGGSQAALDSWGEG